MNIKEIKEFLIALLDRELEEEQRTTNNKDYMKDCIEAKKYLLDKKGIMAIVSNAIIEDDIKKYLQED